MDDPASVTFDPKAASVVNTNGIEQKQQRKNSLVLFLSTVFTITESSRELIALSGSDGGKISRVPSQAPSLLEQHAHMGSWVPTSSNDASEVAAFGELGEEDGSFGSGPYLLIGLMICMFVGVLHITRWRPTYGICQEKLLNDNTNIEENRSPHGGELELEEIVERLEQHNLGEDENNLDKYFLARIGVGVHNKYDAAPAPDHNAAEESSSSVGGNDDRAFACGAIHSLVFEFADGSRTGKLFDADGKCELSLLDQDVVEKRIGPLSCSKSWHEVKEHDYITHIAGSRGNSSDCIYQHITLFTSTNQIFSFGDESTTDFVREGDANGKVSNCFNIEIPNTREAIRNIFSVPAIGLPVIVRDVGQRLERHQYKTYECELHKILMEACCDSTLVPERRNWGQISEYLRLRRAHDELALVDEAMARQGWFLWSPLHIACNAPAPTDIILSLLKIAPYARSLQDKHGNCPSIPRSVMDGM